jgi:hypothetical protein
LRCSGVLLSRIVTACALGVLLFPAAARAEWHITPMIGTTFAGRTTLVDPQLATAKRHLTLGGTGTLLGAGVIGAEALVMLTPGFFETDHSPLSDVPQVAIDGSHALAVMGNVVITVPRRLTEYSLRPFVSAGAGLLHTSLTLAVGKLPPLRTNMAAYNVGGGAIGFLTARTGIRFDLRYYSTLRATEQDPDTSIGPARLHYWTAAVGVVLRR